MKVHKLKGKKVNRIFIEMDELCARFKHAEAHESLKEKINVENLSLSSDVKKYYYYLGKTSLIGLNRVEESQKYLYFSLDQIDDDSQFIDALSINMLGVSYFLSSNYEKAEEYFLKSVELLGTIIDFKKEHIEESLNIYFNVAKFYSGIKKYKEAIDYCDISLKISKLEKINTHLDKLYFEKAYNLAELGEKKAAEKTFMYALSFSDFYNNVLLSNLIKKEVKNFGLQAASMFE